MDSNEPTETKKQAEKISVSQDEPETAKGNDNRQSNQQNKVMKRHNLLQEKLSWALQKMVAPN